MNCRSIPERSDWYLSDRKPQKCPNCGAKEVRKAVLGYPTEEDFLNDNIYLIGCIPDFPIDRTWGCRQCDAAFFKDTPRNKAALGGLVPHQWPPEERTEKEKAKLMEGWIKELKEGNMEIPF